MKLFLKNQSKFNLELHNIDISHFETIKERYLRVGGDAGKLKRIPIENILIENSKYVSTNNLKQRLYKEGS